MKSSTVVAIIAVLLLILAAWYWWPQDSTNTPSNPNATTGSTSETGESTDTSQASSADQYAYAPGNLLLGTDASEELGTYLIASNGMTLYLYTNDAPNVSNCSGQCAEKWPPYTVASLDVLANVQAGIPGTVGTITRADGSQQVTYKGQPLYFWINDHASGDTTGQGVGGVWYVVEP